MKKRTVSLLLVLVMVFSLLPTSAMAQVYPVTGESTAVEVQFYKGEALLSTQRVNNVGSQDGKVPAGAIYDPGCPVSGQEVFLGWQIDGQEGIVPVEAEDDAASIRGYVNDHYSSLAGKSLKVNAIMGEVRYLVYMDENDRVLKTESLLETDNAFKTTVNLDYVPADPAKDFFGWATTQNADTADYQNGDELTLSAAKITLYPVVKQGFWLSFEANIEQDDDPTKAEFTAPQFYVEGQNTTAPTAPSRPGYKLEGWYEDQALTTKYNFNAPITADKTLYAKWVADGTVQYRVIFWQQARTDAAGLPDDQKSYDYYEVGESVSKRSAAAGSEVAITASDTQMGGSGDMTYFQYNSVNTDTDPVKVKGDGSTVLNVYYDRREITYNFWKNSSKNELYQDEIVPGGASYTYHDSWPSGYYMIGKDGPLGADWRPTEGTTLYSYDDLRKENITDDAYLGSYYEYSTASPNANNIYSAGNGKFTWYNGTLYHEHNYWLATRQFAQFYYYENQSGTYAEGTGPEADISHGSTEVTGTYYYYTDPFPSNYYIVGGNSSNVPIVYNQSNPPSASTDLWYYHNGDYEKSSLVSGMGATFPQSTDRDPNNGSGIHYPNSPKGSYTWFEGYLYDYHRDWTNSYYHALYYWYDSRSGYYEVGTGPDPTAKGTHNAKRSTFTGLYGSEFHDWPTLTAGQEFFDGHYGYPIPFSSYAITTSGSYTTDFYPEEDSGTAIKIINYGQSVTGGDTYEEIASGNTTVGKESTWYPEEQYIGFTCDGWRYSTESNWHPYKITNDAKGIATTDSSKDVYIHYARNQHHFVMESNNANVVDDKVYYDASLSKYGSSDYVPTNGPEGAYFGGWYADPGCTTPYDFSDTMPDNDVRVYAKWTTMRFRVLLDPTGGDDTVEKSDISFGGNQTTAFRVDYGEKIRKEAIQAATRAGYQLVGWYSDPEFRNPFNFDFAAWDEIADFDYAAAPAAQRQDTDYWNNNKEWNDVEDAKGTHEDVVGKVTLYAKWRQVMADEDYLTVSYDAGAGSLSAQDENRYADQAQAVALPAAVPPQGSTFSCWQVLDADGEPTVTVYPGYTFDVKLADAVDNTVTLQAVYVSAATTHITWVGNGGATGENETVVSSADANMNAEIAIKPADTFTRDGYTFLGWARLNEADMKNGESWKMNDALTAEDLWLIWDASEGLYRVNSAKDTTVDSGNPVATAISANETAPYHVLYAVWQEYNKVTYVIDFSTNMTVATEATKLTGATDNNGTFTPNETAKTVTYQLTGGKLADKTAVLNKAFSAVDSAVVYGKPVNVKDAEVGWTQITTVPASSVYYSDKLAEGDAITVGDGSGYNAGIGSDASKAADVTTGPLYFTFYGTGIDVYCTTHSEAGYVSAAVFRGAGADACIAANRADKVLGNEAYKAVTMKNQSAVDRYSTPTLSFTGLPADTYTLKINANDGAKYKLDGVRVYNPVQAGSEAAAELSKTAEANATYLNLRHLLVNDNNTTGFTVTNEISTEEGKFELEKVTGVLFLDNADNLVTQWNDENGEAVDRFESDFAAYKANGPKNEIYLGPNQGITFQLNMSKVSAGSTIWIGMSAPESGNGTVSVTGMTDDINVTSVMEMYYPITVPASGSITVKNTGTTSLISLTNLKITGVANLLPASTGNNTNEITDASRALFAPVTMQTIKLAANNGVDPEAVVTEPETPDVPDDPNTPDQNGDIKPGWSDDANSMQSILKNFFQSVLQNLGNLFRGLDKW